MKNIQSRIFPLFLLGYCVLGIVVAAGQAAAAPALPAADSEWATKQLLQAVYVDDLSAVEASVRAGADVDARDRWGLTPTDIAIDRGHYRIAHFLVSIRNARRGPNGAGATAGNPVAAIPTLTTASGGSFSAPATQPAGRGKSETRASVPIAHANAPAAAGSATVPGATLPGWPTGKPNPFDPSAPAPGSQLRSVDESPR